MDSATVRWLAGPGRAVADAIDPRTDPLVGIPRLRALHPDIPAAHLTAAWTLAVTRARHADRLGPHAYAAILTDELAQQASRAQVAAYRARVLAATGARTVLDGTCGAGLDALALLDRGIDVAAVDIDPVAAACADANLVGYHAAGRCLGVTNADVMSVSHSAYDAVFVDPARRNPDSPRSQPGRAPVERDPERWAPAWSWVVRTARSIRTVAKCAPGIPEGLIPPDADIEWVAVGGDVVEATVWFASTGQRRATVITGDDRIRTLAAPRSEAPRSEAGATEAGATEAGATSGCGAGGHGVRGEWLLEPDEAIRRAGLVDLLADELGVHRVHVKSRWLTGSQPCTSDWVTPWRVLEWLEVSGLHAALRGSGPATYKTADTDRSADEVARHVGHRADPRQPGRTVVIINGMRQAALVSRDE